MRLLSSFVAFTLTVCFAISAAAAEPIRIMTFNIRHSLANDGENAWPKRKEFVIDVLRETPQDFIGMQEAIVDPRDEVNQVAYIVSKMPEYGALWLSREKTPEKGESMLLLYKKERWELDKNDHGTFWLSDTPEVAGSKTWPKAGCPRVITFGRFHELATGKRTGKSLYVYNTHYDHMSEEARQRAAVLTLDRLAARKSPKTPLILMGDLNCGEKGVAVRFLQGDPMTLDDAERKPPLTLVDTFRAANPDEKEIGSFNSFKDFAAKDKIDYIFTTSDMKTISARINRIKRDGRWPSDHFPVEAVVNWAQ